MSFGAVSWVVDESTLRGSAFAVLLMVANHEGDHDGHVCAWPSIDRLAAQARVSRRTVINGLEAAEKAGELLIERNTGPNGTNLYHINPQSGGCRFCTGAIQVFNLHPKSKELGFKGSVVATDLDSDLDLKARERVDANPNQPTHDQLDLARKLGETWGQDLKPAAIVKLNKAHGRGNVESAMRSLRGFPPEEAVRKLYAYVGEVARQVGAA